MVDFIASDAAWRQLGSTVKGYAIVFLDTEGSIVAWSEGALTMNLYDAEEIVGRNFREFYTPESREFGHPERELAVAASVGRYEEDGLRVRKDGSRFWAHVTITSIYNDNQVHCGFGMILRDITEQKQSQEQYASMLRLLERSTLTDHLTGLDNRRSLDQFLKLAISRVQQQSEALCVAMIDLDRFKEYNDKVGYQNADIYLQQAVKKWRASLRSADVIARYGGEEFVVVMPDTNLDHALICMERLRAATPAPMTCSIGITGWDGGESQHALLDRADQAMYQAKADGRDRVVMAPAEVAHPERKE